MKLPKETEARAHGKWYDDACGTAFALELIGERWSLLIVRELLFGPRRFTGLRAGLPSISAKVLTERLEGLERAGIVCRVQLPSPASGQAYGLTRWGQMAEEPIMALGRWAAHSADHDAALPLSAASLLMSFRTMFDTGRAGKMALKAAVQIGREHFQVRVRKGRLTAERGQSPSPDFAISAPSAEPIAAMVYGKLPAAQLGAAGLVLVGDAAAAQQFVDLFHLPEKVG